MHPHELQQMFASGPATLDTHRKRFRGGFENGGFDYKMVSSGCASIEGDEVGDVGRWIVDLGQ